MPGLYYRRKNRFARILVLCNRTAYGSTAKDRFWPFPSRRRRGKGSLKRPAKPRPRPTARRFRYLSTRTRKRVSRHYSRYSLEKGVRKRTDDPQPQRTEPDHG